jgi:hypothetical protein
LFDSLIQRLEYARIDGSNDVDRGIQFFFGHACFPCIRKAPLHSRIAEPHHRYGQSDKHLLPLAEAFDGMSITIELAKVRFLQCRILSV